MTKLRIRFERANKYVPFILLVGIGIGVGQYALNGDEHFLRVIFLQTVTSLIVGYGIMLVVFNQDLLPRNLANVNLRYGAFVVLFSMIGLIASEVEMIVRMVILQGDNYLPFSGGGIYLFNVILSSIIGLGTLVNPRFAPDFDQSHEAQEPEVGYPELSEAIKHIPVKQGESIHLIPLDQILYFEAYDNYSFVINQQDEKKLCDYSLGFLDERLDTEFLRVHRKYIINTTKIKQVEPYLNGRYKIYLGSDQSINVISSKSFGPRVKTLIRLS